MNSDVSISLQPLPVSICVASESSLAGSEVETRISVPKVFCEKNTRRKFGSQKCISALFCSHLEFCPLLCIQEITKQLPLQESIVLSLGPILSTSVSLRVQSLAAHRHFRLSLLEHFLSSLEGPSYPLAEKIASPLSYIGNQKQIVLSFLSLCLLLITATTKHLGSSFHLPDNLNS